MPAGLGTLFVGAAAHRAGVRGGETPSGRAPIRFYSGCSAAAALCWARRCAIWAILYTRGQDLLMQVFKLLLGLILPAARLSCFRISPPT